MPAELGREGRGTNPEQLFAAGFAACFHVVRSLVARRAAFDPALISVEATVALGRDPGGRRPPAARRPRGEVARRRPEAAAPLLAEADSLCPYAKMARRGTPTIITLSS